MENNIEHFCDIEPVMDFDNFAELFLASFANSSKMICSSDKEIRKGVIPIYYKELIQSIMYNQDNWNMKLYTLFDIRLYYNKQYIWEKEFGAAINKCLRNDNIKHTYNFENDTIEVEYRKEEIEKVFQKFDKECLDIMEIFINLILAYDVKKKANNEEFEQSCLDKIKNLCFRK